MFDDTAFHVAMGWKKVALGENEEFSRLHEGI